MQKHQGSNPSSVISDLDKKIVVAERQREAQDRFIVGLRAAREAMAGVVIEGAAHPRPFGQGPRSAVLQEILESSVEPMPVDRIVAELKRRDVHAPRASINATLAYLKRKGVAKNPERGKWASVTSIAA